MNKNLLKKYLNDDSFKSVVVVIGNKRIVLENDIHVDYENEVIIYPCKNCTRIIPFSSISSVSYTHLTLPTSDLV